MAPPLVGVVTVDEMAARRERESERENDVAIGIPPTCLPSPCSFFLISALFIDTPVNVSPNFGMPLSPLRCGIHLHAAQPQSGPVIASSSQPQNNTPLLFLLPLPTTCLCPTRHSPAVPLHSASLPFYSQTPSTQASLMTESKGHLAIWICKANGVLCQRLCCTYSIPYLHFSLFT